MARMDTIRPGSRVYRYVWVGGNNWNPQPLNVIRVNAKTVTVETDQGSRFRIPPTEIEGRWDEDE